MDFPRGRKLKAHCLDNFARVSYLSRGATSSKTQEFEHLDS